MSNQVPKLIVILGPTATGKTNLAVKLARRFNGEIISADSRQVYQAMDIGTGKDLKEYNKIPYHLINIIKPTTHFNVAKFKKRAERVIAQITSQNKLPFLVGGTGLYISALIENYQFPAQAKSKYQTLQLGLTWPKKDLDARIDKRVDARIKQGMIQEVKKLHATGVSWQRLDDFGLEYRFIARYLRGELSKDKMITLLKIAIHQFAKRQMTWFKRDKRIKWIKNYKQAEKLVKNFLK